MSAVADALPFPCRPAPPPKARRDDARAETEARNPD
jgi:hypothetical protein